jgi:hypothetical protein
VTQVARFFNNFRGALVTQVTRFSKWRVFQTTFGAFLMTQVTRFLTTFVAH